MNNTITPNEVPKAKKDVYFVRVSGRTHQELKKLAKEVGIDMQKLGDMILANRIEKIREEGLNIKVVRTPEGNTITSISSNG